MIFLGITVTFLITGKAKIDNYLIIYSKLLVNLVKIILWDTEKSDYMFKKIDVACEY